MNKKLAVCVLILASFGQTAPFAHTQEVDGSDLRREAEDRNERASKLSLEEQLKLRAAQTKAAEDPEVKEALRLRNEAVTHFRQTVRASMLRADPSIKAILEKITPTIGAK